MKKHAFGAVSGDFFPIGSVLDATLEIIEFVTPEMRPLVFLKRRFFVAKKNQKKSKKVPD
jgi:hypothetical protein